MNVADDIGSSVVDSYAVASCCLHLLRNVGSAQTGLSPGAKVPSVRNQARSRTGMEPGWCICAVRLIITSSSKWTLLVFCDVLKMANGKDEDDDDGSRTGAHRQ